MLVTILIGLPGSGKSFVAKKLSKNPLRNTYIVSSDSIREEICGNPNDQSHNAEVFQTLKERIVSHLELYHNVIVDATNINRKNRLDIVHYIEEKIVGFCDYNLIKYLIVATPYYQCQINNLKRDRQVPREVIERMYKNFEFPTFTELYGGEIEIYYPFILDKEFYGVEHPYDKLFNISHDNPHHSKSIGGHLFEAYQKMSQMTNDKVMLKAAELHDIGKPFCKTTDEEGVAHYRSHDNVGSYEAMFYGKILGYSDREIVELCNLIEFHMKSRFCKTEKALTKLKNLVGEEIFFKLKMLNIVDEEAH